MAGRGNVDGLIWVAGGYRAISGGGGRGVALRGSVATCRVIGGGAKVEK